MNALAASMLGVAKGYLGPAAQQFLSRELHAIGVNANTVTPDHVAELVARVRETGARAMGQERADQLAEAIAKCAVSGKRPSNGHRLASDAAAKLLASGKLRGAEKAYQELVAKHGDADAYVGLARTLAALEDVPAALTTLREGAASFARRNDRATAVSLLAEAVAIAPDDLSAHRRLAAALANQGDLPGAVEEYARFVDAVLAMSDRRRALLELAYGRETLGELPALVALVDRVSGNPPAPRRTPPPPATTTHAEAVVAPPVSVAPPAPLRVPQVTVPQPPAVAPAAPPASLRESKASVAQPATEPAAPPPTAAVERAPMKQAPAAASAVATALGSKPSEIHPSLEVGEAVDVLARAGVVKSVEREREKTRPRPLVDVEPQLALLRVSGSGLDAAAIAASRAAILTGAGDARATDAVLDAARRLLALGKVQSASDVLLDYIAHGFTDREAQRLLIEVDCGLGRRDVAKEKCSLLSHAYRLDGRADTAEDVERLARLL